ncbi:helix-turn-helix transcriptional regulator [Polynucleobacter sp. 71A-WALBACH]|uniref:helix-turn-helix domain-containing protein n=1 Tax=Polynucleobacter sp. 71A-WALBACH TaxID=2689097 RepID=UPI001C0B244E|nr:LuxR C-terminal-related transcriptional regulator [Polynucleobacter sp. 71A-WALBACH]
MNSLRSPIDRRGSKSLSAATNSSKKSSVEQVSLSGRQQEIISLLAEGKSNKEISDFLKIGYGTVKQHLFVLFRKLGVSNRTKAVIAANQLMKEHPNDFGVTTKSAPQKGKLALARAGGHSWRLVSAVVISIPDTALATPEELDWRNQYLLDLRDVLKGYVDALDGQFLLLPYGGMLAWFGYPNTHLDDADRAVQLAQFTQQYSNQYLTQDSEIDPEKIMQHAIGIGIASKPEMSSDKANELFASDAFRVAAILARNARVLNRPLTDTLTKKLAPFSVSWLTVKAKAPELIQVGEIAAIADAHVAPLDASPLWGGLPFMDGVMESVKSGVAQWVAVESWPPSLATSLIDALGNAAQLNGFKSIHLRTPSQQRRDKLLQSFIVQAENSHRDLDFSVLGLPVSAGGGERLGAFLAQQAILRPLVIQVYGLKALEAFKYALGDRGIDRMAARPILVIVANLKESGSSQTSVRLLGPRPIEMPFSRVYSMNAPTQESLPENIRVDMQAILDDLSAHAQSIVMTASQNPEKPIEEVISILDLPHHQIQSGLQELASAGFILARQGGGFEFRDQATAEAIQHLSLPRA